LRVASKSVRCRELLTRVLARPGWAGVLAFTLAEANWLVRTGVTNDAVVAYPTADRAALRDLAGDERLRAGVTLMVDSAEQLDFIESITGATDIRLCLDLDASYRLAGGRVHLGVFRSPVHAPDQARSLAEAIEKRAGFRLIGIMSYEAQIAGLGDAPPGQRARGVAIRAIQRRSYKELLARRGATVDAVREVADLEFVNGGGTGSVRATGEDPSVTEITAGSGLYGPTLFDAYRAFKPAPAAWFALPVVRKPSSKLATALGGGYPASGAAGRDRLPRPVLPAGLKLDAREGAGEVQTPLVGKAAAALRVGDRVWFRHAKAGELCERFDVVHLLAGGEIVDSVPTYRGEGKTFL
jgi:D-serine deaminase-like pyridoxal phosphate-dependent protein